ncbi:unnamed protein product [Rotaria sordida]|uniref:Ion transport domain-containing protein n=2 Tax=Rotaria sordida TaxID=392033 RepID=A0A815H1Q1_9BILA|nr:unnamed protein product [Rotaria sordida]
MENTIHFFINNIVDNIIFPLQNADVTSDNSEVEQQTELMLEDNTIWRAVYNADKIAIDRFIDADPDLINKRGAVGECPIHLLFLRGTDAHFDIARDLILRFPTIVTQTYYNSKYHGENILHIAIVQRNPAMVEWLLSNDHLEPFRQQLLTARTTGSFFKIGELSYYGEVPLGFACCTNQWDIVEILLKYGADMDVTDSNSNTILHMLVICNLPEIYAKFKARWIEQQIIHNGKNKTDSKLTKPLELWNRLNKDGLTPLTLATDLGQAKMLSWLLEERKRTLWSYGNVTCVVHPLNQLDVDFHQDNKERPLSVLEVMIKKNNAELINPIVISLIDKKWRSFAYQIFVRRFLIVFLYLLVFLVTTTLRETRSEKTASELDEKTGITNGKRWSVFDQFLYSVGHIIVIIGAALRSVYEIDEMRRSGFRNYWKITESTCLGNYLVCSFCFCIFTCEILHLFGMQQYETQILAFTSLIGWGNMLFFITPFQFTGPFVIMIYKMLFNDVLRFFIIYIIFLVGFAQSFCILFNGYGDFDLDYYIGGEYPLTSVILLIFYVVLITILLLNLLIAMMGDTYTDVKRSAKKLWHLERARIALQIQNSMPISKRLSSFKKYWVNIGDERCMQVEEKVNNKQFQTTDDEANND